MGKTPLKRRTTTGKTITRKLEAKQLPELTSAWRLFKFQLAREERRDTVEYVEIFIVGYLGQGRWLQQSVRAGWAREQ